MPSAHVVSVERMVDDDGSPVVNVQVDLGGGDPITAEQALAPGDDSLPLPGDVAATVDDGGTGSEFAVGYQDTKNPGKAEPGEKRFYARSDDGSVVAEFWLRKTGDIEITSLKSGGKVTINGVTIDQDGNIATPGKVDASGEVTAMASAAPVKLSTHTHIDAMGGTAPPTPGT